MYQILIAVSVALLDVIGLTPIRAIKLNAYIKLIAIALTSTFISVEKYLCNAKSAVTRR